MAFFKFRKGAGDSPAAPSQPESVEVLRRRARHRLIGAAVLVLLGVIGFPILFDTQPRPVAVDIPIEIPDRNKAKPLPPAAPVAAAPAKAVAEKALPEKAVAAGPVTAAAPAPVVAEPKASAPAAAAKPEPPVVPVPPETVAKVDPAPKAAASSDGARAKALLEGKAAAAGGDEGQGRFIVQVGAFADPAKARETRQKVDKAGLKTYVHEAETKEGKRIRVRVGPFATRAEAEKAAGRIKELDLPAAILTL